MRAAGLCNWRAPTMPLFVYAPPFYLLLLLPTARAFAPRFGAVRRPTPSSQMVADSRARSKAQGRGGCCYKASDCLASTAGNPEGASEPPEPSSLTRPLACSCTLPGAMPRAPPVSLSAAAATSCEALLRSTFEGIVDADAVASACASDVEWDDMSAGGPVSGPAAVRSLIAAKYPRGTRLVLDRVSDGRTSGGFVFHREAEDRPGAVGLRGTLFAELDAVRHTPPSAVPLSSPAAASARTASRSTAALAASTSPLPPSPPATRPRHVGDTSATGQAGLLRYVREGCEPIIKPGEATEALLGAAAACRYDQRLFTPPAVNRCSATRPSTRPL